MKLRPHLDLNVTQTEDLIYLLQQRELTDSDTCLLYTSPSPRD